MAQLNSLFLDINSITPANFNELAISVFNYQASQNPVFNKYLKALGHSGQAKAIEELVFLPIEFFKNHTIKTEEWKEETVFESSGTTGAQTSRHFIYSLKGYQKQTADFFEKVYGPLEEYVILALLPSYLDRGNSGLIAMVDHFIKKTANPASGFYLDDFEALRLKLRELKAQGQKTLLWGVTFALLDFAEANRMEFSDLLIMETGGMKGRRKEMVRDEVHQIVGNAFNIDQVHSEYGMTEMSSQAYSKADGIFEPAPTLKVIARDINDPFAGIGYEKTGALNVIDLQNLQTCAFIETKDLGRVYSDGTFEVMGRMDNSDVRGCNLMVL